MPPLASWVFRVFRPNSAMSNRLRRPDGARNAAGVGDPLRDTDPCQSLSPENQPVEQDRASHVLPHPPDWRSRPLNQSRSHYQSDRKHHHSSRLENPRGFGETYLPCRYQDHRCSIRCVTSQDGQVPWRLKLCILGILAATLQQLIMLFSRDSEVQIARYFFNIR